MEREHWPELGTRVTFLTEGPHTPLPPPDTRQDTYRFPAGTRVVHLDGGLGFLIAHDEHMALWIGHDGRVKEAPLDKAGPLIEARANTMDASAVLRFGVMRV